MRLSSLVKPRRIVRFARTKMEQARFRLNDATRIKTTCRIGGQPIRVEAGSPEEANRIKRYVNNEPDTVAWIAEFVKAGDVFFDVGANIGLYSIFAAKRLNGQVEVYAFEPESQNYASLNRNVHLNGLSDSITTLCLAVSDSIQIDRFYVRGHLRAGESIHQFGAPVDHQGVSFSPVHQQGMIGLSLDDLCYVYGLAVPNHMKIDVDGHEAAVIKGAQRVLSDPRLKSVHLEITEAPRRMAGVREIFDCFQATGLTMPQKAELTSGTEGPRIYNALFVRAEKP